MSESVRVERRIDTLRGVLAIVAVLAAVLSFGTPWMAAAFLVGAYGIAQGHAWSWMLIAGAAGSQFWWLSGAWLGVFTFGPHVGLIAFVLLQALLYSSLVVLALHPRVRLACQVPPAVR